MKLKELKEVLADSIESVVVNIKEEGEQETELVLDLTKRSPQDKLLAAVEGEDETAELNNYDVETTYVGTSGFIVQMKYSDSVLKAMYKQGELVRVSPKVKYFENSL